MEFLISDIPYFQTPNDIFETDLSNNEKLSYMYICRCANNGKVAFPSYQTIADKCSFSRRTAISSIKKLIETGYILKQARYKDGEAHSNLYKVNYNIGSAMVAPPSETDTPPSETVAPYKELSINNSLKTNNNLHQSQIDVCTSDNVPIIQILEAYSQNRFNKSIRSHRGVYDLDVIEYMDSEELLDFLWENITKYDYCNLDYISTIESRAM